MKKANIEKYYGSNNSRKMAGLPLRRKANSGKRYKTRCEAIEAVSAFLDYVNGTPAKTSYHR